VTEFDIQGDVIIAGSRIIVPVGVATVLPGVAIAVSTIQSPIPISGTINVGTVVADIQGGTVTVASVLSPVTVQGTVTTSGGGGGGTVQVAGGTLDVNVISGTVELVGGSITAQQAYQRTNVLAGATVTAGTTSATLTAMALQDLVVDTYYGSVNPAAGSVQTVVWGVEPQSGQLTSPIASGSWVSGTVGPAGQRIQAAGPLGELVVVQVTVAAGTVGPAYVSAEQSSSD
jgi:hypothetical protein